MRPRDTGEGHVQMEEEGILIATKSQGLNGAVRSWTGKGGFPLRACGGRCVSGNTLILNF